MPFSTHSPLRPKHRSRFDSFSSSHTSGSLQSLSSSLGSHHTKVKKCVGATELADVNAAAAEDAATGAGIPRYYVAPWKCAKKAAAVEVIERSPLMRSACAFPLSLLQPVKTEDSSSSSSQQQQQPPRKQQRTHIKRRVSVLDEYFVPASLHTHVKTEHHLSSQSQLRRCNTSATTAAADTLQQTRKADAAAFSCLLPAAASTAARRSISNEKLSRALALLPACDATVVKRPTDCISNVSRFSEEGPPNPFQKAVAASAGQKQRALHSVWLLTFRTPRVNKSAVLSIDLLEACEALDALIQQQLQEQQEPQLVAAASNSQSFSSSILIFICLLCTIAQLHCKQQQLLLQTAQLLHSRVGTAADWLAEQQTGKCSLNAAVSGVQTALATRTAATLRGRRAATRKFPIGIFSSMKLKRKRRRPQQLQFKKQPEQQQLSLLFSPLVVQCSSQYDYSQKLAFYQQQEQERRLFGDPSLLHQYKTYPLYQQQYHQQSWLMLGADPPQSEQQNSMFVLQRSQGNFCAREDWACEQRGDLNLQSLPHNYYSNSSSSSTLDKSQKQQQGVNSSSDKYKNEQSAIITQSRHDCTPFSSPCCFSSSSSFSSVVGSRRNHRSSNDDDEEQKTSTKKNHCEGILPFHFGQRTGLLSSGCIFDANPKPTEHGLSSHLLQLTTSNSSRRPSVVADAAPPHPGPYTNSTSNFQAENLLSPPPADLAALSRSTNEAFRQSSHKQQQQAAASLHHHHIEKQSQNQQQQSTTTQQHQQDPKPHLLFLQKQPQLQPQLQLQLQLQPQLQPQLQLQEQLQLQLQEQQPFSNVQQQQLQGLDVCLSESALYREQQRLSLEQEGRLNVHYFGEEERDFSTQSPSVHSSGAASPLLEPAISTDSYSLKMYTAVAAAATAAAATAAAAAEEELKKKMFQQQQQSLPYLEREVAVGEATMLLLPPPVSSPLRPPSYLSSSTPLLLSVLRNSSNSSNSDRKSNNSLDHFNSEEDNSFSSTTKQDQHDILNQQKKRLQQLLHPFPFRRSKTTSSPEYLPPEKQLLLPSLHQHQTQNPHPYRHHLPYSNNTNTTTTITPFEFKNRPRLTSSSTTTEIALKPAPWAASETTPPETETAALLLATDHEFFDFFSDEESQQQQQSLLLQQSNPQLLVIDSASATKNPLLGPKKTQQQQQRLKQIREDEEQLLAILLNTYTNTDENSLAFLAPDQSENTRRPSLQLSTTTFACRSLGQQNTCSLSGPTIGLSCSGSSSSSHSNECGEKTTRIHKSSNRSNHTEEESCKNNNAVETSLCVLKTQNRQVVPLPVKTVLRLMTYDKHTELQQKQQKRHQSGLRIEQKKSLQKFLALSAEESIGQRNDKNRKALSFNKNDKLDKDFFFTTAAATEVVVEQQRAWVGEETKRRLLQCAGECVWAFLCKQEIEKKQQFQASVVDNGKKMHTPALILHTAGVDDKALFLKNSLAHPVYEEVLTAVVEEIHNQHHLLSSFFTSSRRQQQFNSSSRSSRQQTGHDERQNHSSLWDSFSWEDESAGSAAFALARIEEAETTAVTDASAVPELQFGDRKDFLGPQHLEEDAKKEQQQSNKQQFFRDSSITNPAAAVVAAHTASDARAFSLSDDDENFSFSPHLSPSIQPLITAPAPTTPTAADVEKAAPVVLVTVEGREEVSEALILSSEAPAMQRETEGSVANFAASDGAVREQLSQKYGLPQSAWTLLEALHFHYLSFAQDTMQVPSSLPYKSMKTTRQKEPFIFEPSSEAAAEQTKTPAAAAPPEKVALQELLQGHSRSTAAQAFFDSLLLHACGIVSLSQQRRSSPPFFVVEEFLEKERQEQKQRRCCPLNKSQDFFNAQAPESGPEIAEELEASDSTRHSSKSHPLYGRFPPLYLSPRFSAAAQAATERDVGLSNSLLSMSKEPLKRNAIHEQAENELLPQQQEASNWASSCCVLTEEKPKKAAADWALEVSADDAAAAVHANFDFLSKKATQTAETGKPAPAKRASSPPFRLLTPTAAIVAQKEAQYGVQEKQTERMTTTTLEPAKTARVSLIAVDDHDAEKDDLKFLKGGKERTTTLLGAAKISKKLFSKSKNPSLRAVDCPSNFAFLSKTRQVLHASERKRRSRRRRNSTKKTVQTVVDPATTPTASACKLPAPASWIPPRAPPRLLLQHYDVSQQKHQQQPLLQKKLAAPVERSVQQLEQQRESVEARERQRAQEKQQAVQEMTANSSCYSHYSSGGELDYYHPSRVLTAPTNSLNALHKAAPVGLSRTHPPTAQHEVEAPAKADAPTRTIKAFAAATAADSPILDAFTASLADDKTSVTMTRPKATVSIESGAAENTSAAVADARGVATISNEEVEKKEKYLNFMQKPTDEQIELAVELVITRLLHRLSHTSLVHSEELVQWFLTEHLVSSSGEEGITSEYDQSKCFKSVEAKETEMREIWRSELRRALKTLYDEGVLLGSDVSFNISSNSSPKTSSSHNSVSQLWIEGVNVLPEQGEV